MKMMLFGLLMTVSVGVVAAQDDATRILGVWENQLAGFSLVFRADGTVSSLGGASGSAFLSGTTHWRIEGESERTLVVYKVTPSARRELRYRGLRISDDGMTLTIVAARLTFRRVI